jgi:hypothetical protein
MVSTWWMSWKKWMMFSGRVSNVKWPRIVRRQAFFPVNDN